VVPSKLILVTLVQIASAESYHAAGTPYLLEVAAITVRAPLTVGATCVPQEVMLPSTLTQVLRIGIIATGGTDIGGTIVVGEADGVGEVDTVGETAVGSVLANAPVKLRPNTAIAVNRIAAIIVFFLVIVFMLINSSF
jgi:hypothetical protein